jgi:pyruvate formate lyase activating enzyme
MEIKGFIENSLLEWEGRLSCILFLPMCNLRCRYCHAAHLLEPSALESIPREQVLACMHRNRGWLDGAVITGGEPTLHGEELLDLMRDIHNAGLDVMLETNGTRPEWVERIIEGGWIQAIAMDVKGPLEEESYRNVTGRTVAVDDIRSSMDTIKNSGLPHEFRITVVPGLVGANEIERMKADLAGADTVAIQNFQPAHCLDPALRDIPPYLPREMDAMKDILEGCVQRVVIRGRERGVAARGSGMRAG